MLQILFVVISFCTLSQAMLIGQEKDDEKGLYHKLVRAKRQSYSDYNCPDYVAVPNSCTKFQRCANGIFYDYDCPAGTVFNAK